MFSIDLLRDAVVLGVLLGCFYAAVSVGLSISFGLLDVPQVAHPAFLVLASYGVYLLNDSYDIDPLVAGLIITPLFFLLGFVAYRLYYEMFEKRGSDADVRGIAFFFGIAFIIEVLIILQFGVDQRSVTAPYIGKAWRIGDMRIPYRQLVAFGVALALTVSLVAYLSKTFMGRAIRAVAQDEEGLRLMGANPVRIKQIRLRDRDRGARSCRRASHHRRSGRSDARPPLYRTHLLRRGHGRARQHHRHADRLHHPRRRRDHRADDVRRVLGARDLVCAAAWRACSEAARPVRQVSHGS